MTARSRRGAVVGLVGLACVGLLSIDPAAALETERPACVSHQTEARFRMGYDHLVHITNQCTRPVQCSVRTNVNPDTLHVRVRAKSTETVLTFRGSPANTFRAEVACDWAK